MAEVWRPITVACPKSLDRVKLSKCKDCPKHKTIDFDLWDVLCTHSKGGK